MTFTLDELKPIEEEASEDTFINRTGSGFTLDELKPIEGITQARETAPKSKYRMPLIQGIADKYPDAWDVLRNQLPGVALVELGYQHLDFFPFAKYLRSEDVRYHKSLSPADQQKALAMEALGAALWLGGGLILKGAGKLSGMAYRAGAKALAKQPLGMKPIEDLGVWTAKSYAKTTEKFLRKDLGLNKIERIGVAKALQGSKTSLKDVFLASKKTPSEQFTKMLERIPGEPYGQFRLNAEATKRLAGYTPGAVRRRHYLEKFNSTVKKKRFFGDKYTEYHPEAAFKVSAERLLGKEAAKGVTLKNASSQELFSFTQHLLDNPSARRQVGRVLGVKALAKIRPVRVIFGLGEAVLGTSKGIYEKIVRGSGQANVHTAKKVIEYQEIMAQKGLYSRTVSKAGEVGYKRTKAFNIDVGNEAFRIMGEKDRLLSQIKKVTPEEALGIQDKMAKLITTVKPGVDKNLVRDVIDGTHVFLDKLYAERMSWKLSEVFHTAGLTPTGRIGVEMAMEKLNPRIQNIFKTSRALGPDKKISEINGILNDARSVVQAAAKGGGSPWFNATGKDLAKVVQGLEGELKLGKGGAFVEYLEDYLPRLFRDEAKFGQELFRGIGGKMAPFYTKPRFSTEVTKARLGPDELIHARINAQAKEMFLYPELVEVSKFASNLPSEWKDFTSHYIARVLGMPSPTDEWIARKILEPTIGGIERHLMGRQGIWDARRVMNLGQNINDFTYMGFLGLKPFSAMRNLFQPLLLVPADLGGAKDLGHLIKGYKIGTSKAGRKYLQDIGIITDYVPEQMRTARIFDFRKKALGLQIPNRNEVREVAMWMFRGSDKLNRYVTGGAAMSKWDGALAKVGTRSTSKFMAKAGVNGRYPWIRNEIESLVKAGDMKAARDMFVKDVVADTQYLYGKLDSPLVMQAGGGLGRTGMIFQSWWMNYGTAMEKWATTGVIDAKAHRAIAWVLSGAIAMKTMEQIWSRETALKTVALGPFPFPRAGQGFPLPPAWDATAKTLATIPLAYEIIVGAKKPETMAKQAKRLVSTGISFMPGGLQAKQFYRGAKKEGWPGLAKAFIKYNPSED